MGLRKTSSWSQHFLFGERSRLLSMKQFRCLDPALIARPCLMFGWHQTFLCCTEAPLPRPGLLLLPVLRPPVPRKATAVTGDAQPCLQGAVATEWPVCARWVVGPGAPGERGAQAPPQASAGPCAPRFGPFLLSSPVPLRFQVPFCSRGCTLTPRLGAPSSRPRDLSTAWPSCRVLSLSPSRSPRPAPCPSLSAKPLPLRFPTTEDPGREASSVSCFQNKKGTRTRSHPFLLTTHHAGNHSIPSHRRCVSAPVLGPAHVSGRCYLPQPHPVPSTSIFARLAMRSSVSGLHSPSPMSVICPQLRTRISPS